MKKPSVEIVVAIGKNRELGKDNKLLWHIGDDLRRFKELTVGHPIIMGRKTYESIGRPLPGRTNIVITRNLHFQVDGVIVVHSLKEALETGAQYDNEKVFIIGGSQIYEQALPVTDKLYLTIISDEKEGDAYFPLYEHIFTKKVFEEKRFDEKIGLYYTWVDLERE